MNLEIHKPELLQRVNAHIRTGRFHDADELLEKALDAAMAYDLVLVTRNVKDYAGTGIAILNPWELP
jgi:predicted nucleic acid-binding protein